MYTPKKFGGNGNSSSPARGKRVSTNRATQSIPVGDNLNLNVRKIENGYLVSQSGYSGKGKKQKYVSKDTYYATNPLEAIPAPPTKK